MSPPCARPARRTYSRPWPTRRPCSTPSSREPPLGVSGGRARSQGAGARGGPRLGGDDPRAAGVRGVAAHRPSRGSVPARPGGAAPRVVSGDGRAARGRRRAARHRAGDRGHGPRPRAVSSRIVAVLRGSVRGPNGPGRPPRPVKAPVKIPMPLRVPELAPSLGRVLVPRRLEEPWVPLDDIREELATRVMELGGEARAAAAGDDRD